MLGMHATGNGISAMREREEVKEKRRGSAKQFSSLLGRLKGPLIRAKLNITSCLEGLVSDREVTG